MEDKIYKSDDDKETSYSSSQLLNNILTEEIPDFVNAKPEKESVSICKLIYHLSGSKEEFLIFLGTIGCIISAISGPVMSYTFGGAINDFSNIQDLSKVDINYKIKINQFVLNIKGVYTRYLILGAI